jgi:hypothetical protein
MLFWPFNCVTSQENSDQEEKPRNEPKQAGQAIVKKYFVSQVQAILAVKAENPENLMAKHFR